VQSPWSAECAAELDDRMSRRAREQSCENGNQLAHLSRPQPSAVQTAVGNLRTIRISEFLPGITGLGTGDRSRGDTNREQSE
jgi:hypothetical protein